MEVEIRNRIHDRTIKSQDVKRIAWVTGSWPAQIGFWLGVPDTGIIHVVIGPRTYLLQVVDSGLHVPTRTHLDWANSDRNLFHAFARGRVRILDFVEMRFDGAPAKSPP